MRFFGASLWRFPSFLHARDETTGTATQRRMPSVLRLRTGVRIPPPPAFARVNNERASAWQARLRAPERACALRLGRPCNARSLSRCQARRAKADLPPFFRAITRFPSASIRASCLCGCMSDNYCVYILESLIDPERHYTGHTSSAVAARLGWHNDGRSHHTAKHRPWRVIVTIHFEDERVAIAFERYLKSGSGRAFAKRHFV